MITQELKNFTEKLSSDITKNTQAYTTAQENTGKLIEDAILQALTKSQNSTDSTPLNLLQNLEAIRHQIHLMKQIGPCPGQKLIILCSSNQIMTYITYKDPTKQAHPNRLM